MNKILFNVINCQHEKGLKNAINFTLMNAVTFSSLAIFFCTKSHAVGKFLGAKKDIFDPLG